MKSDQMFNAVLAIYTGAGSYHKTDGKELFDFICSHDTLHDLYADFVAVIKGNASAPFGGSPKQLEKYNRYIWERFFLDLIADNSIVPAKVKLEALCSSIDFSGIYTLTGSTNGVTKQFLTTSEVWELMRLMKGFLEAALVELSSSKNSRSFCAKAREFRNSAELILNSYREGYKANWLYTAVRNFISVCRRTGHSFFDVYGKFVYNSEFQEYIDRVTKAIIDRTPVNPFKEGE